MTLLRLLPVLLLLIVLDASPAQAASACSVDMFKNSTTPATCPAASESFSITVQRSCGPTSPTTSNTINTYRLFSSTTCRVQKVVETTLGQLWCVVKDQIRMPLAALITLYLATVGAMIIIGMVQLSTGEAMKQFLKIILIWLFATEGDYAIEMGYGFFSTIISEGITMVTSAGSGIGGVTGVVDRFDTIVSELLLTNAGSKVLSVGVGIAALQASTPIGGTIGLFLIMTVAYSIITLLRCIIHYLVSISAIAFLWAFSPIFLCTALFRTSGHVFSNWLTFMISFTLQPILLFGFLAFMEQHLVNSVDVFSCLVQERTAILRTVPEYNGTLGLIPDQPYRLTQDAYCKGDSYCVCNDATAQDCACETASGARGAACQIITTEAGWTQATDFMNTIGGQILAALLIMIMTNAFLLRLPQFASALTGVGVSLVKSIPLLNALDRDGGIMNQVNSWSGYRPAGQNPDQFTTTYINQDGTLNRANLNRSLIQTAQKEMDEI